MEPLFYFLLGVFCVLLAEGLEWLVPALMSSLKHRHRHHRRGAR